jgi:hypothetical protein
MVRWRTTLRSRELMIMSPLLAAGLVWLPVREKRISG